MHLSPRILGAHVVTALEATGTRPVLTIGRDTFTRRMLARTGCFNFIAAARLNTAIATLAVKSTQDLFERMPPSALVLPGIGAVSLAVLGAAFEVQRIGGARPLEAWVARHRPTDASRDFVTFSTMKAREASREPGEPKARATRAARTHARRQTAQGLRVGRFLTRAMQKESASAST